MPPADKIPPLLRPYLSPPAQSVVLLTSVVNATASWLLLRFVAANLATRRDGTASHTTVVLLSFLADWDFWRDGARRLGCDLASLASSGHFFFIDGLSELFSTDASTLPASRAPGRYTLQSVALPSVEAGVLSVLAHANKSSGNTLLLVDSLDFLVAARGLSAQAALDMLTAWRLQARATVLAIAADAPLVHEPSTPLETQHAALVVGAAHRASYVMSTRRLRTGAAQDVSGVLRVSRGGQADELAETELLYHVSADGGVRLWKRQ